MANSIRVIVLGGDTRTLDGVETVGQVKERTQTLTYTAAVNGVPAGDSQVLSDSQTVTLSLQQKGG